MTKIDMSFDAELAKAVALKLEEKRIAGQPVTDEMVRDAILEGSADFREAQENAPPAEEVLPEPDAEFDALQRRWLIATLRMCYGPIHFDSLSNDDLADWWAKLGVPDDFVEWCGRRMI